MTTHQFKLAWFNFKRQLAEDWLTFRIFCKLKIDGWRLDFAIFMCDALQRANNKRFYVIRNAQDKLIWVCNEDIKLMKKPRRVRKIINGKLQTFKVSMLPKHITHLDIMKEALYYTPSSRNNSDGLSPAERMQRRQGWLKYMERIRMNRITGKLTAK